MSAAWHYTIRGDHVYAIRPLSKADVLRIAEGFIAADFYAAGATFTDPRLAGAYLRSKLQCKPAECFAVVFLDNRHRVIAYEELFNGTIDGASVHPREVVRRVIVNNAAAVILAHNHPSGVGEPSRADLAITRRLIDALTLIDVRVLDHLIVGEGEPTSMAERGLL